MPNANAIVGEDTGPRRYTGTRVVIGSRFVRTYTTHMRRAYLDGTRARACKRETLCRLITLRRTTFGYYPITGTFETFTSKAPRGLRCKILGVAGNFRKSNFPLL